jgi:hypothetical protein
MLYGNSIFRFALATCVALLVGLGDGASAAGDRICKPALSFADVKLSPVDRETMQRTWTATVLVDAARCATSSGRFEILFARLKENAPELDFTEAFEWRPGGVQVSVDFWADEAVEAYWATGIVECPCRR